MNRKYIALLGNSLIGSAIIAVIVFGFYGAVIWGFFGGISQVVEGVKAPGVSVEILKGIMKVMCCGTIAVVAVMAINKLVDALDWIHAWRLGRV